MDFAGWLQKLTDIIWGPAMLAFMTGTGIYLMVKLRFLPLKNMWYAVRQVFTKQPGDSVSGDITPFESLMTALAATMGTGNIVGVATAMVLGGPGSLVWMLVSAVTGLSTKYAESVLAVCYREKNSRGEMVGGPMYVLKKAIPFKPLGSALGWFFALAAALAAFGIGNMTQGNSVAEAAWSTFGIRPEITGIVMTVLVLFVLLGGIKSIGKVCGALVPVMSVLYFLAAFAVIFCHYKNIPSGIAEILTMSVSPRAMGGGAVGSVMANAMRWGIARGVFSNEAGLGSAPIAAAAARTDYPSRQGYINMTGNFFDTIVVCTMTGLAISASGILGTIDPATGMPLTGGALTIAAFKTALGPMGAYVIAISIVLFAFATIVGWEYYGEKALEYLVGSPCWNKWYRIIYCLIVYVGATMKLETVWNLSDVLNGLMAVPNLISLLLLAGVVKAECFSYQKNVIDKGKGKW